MNENKLSLTKFLGRTDVLALGFGIIVGWIWIMFATTWLTEAGFWGAIISFLLGSLLIAGIGIIYSELTSAMPRAGGELVFTYRALGKNAAWLVGWMMTFAYTSVAAWEGISIATAIETIVPIGMHIPLWEIAGYTVYLSWAMIGVVGALIIVLLNMFSSKPAILFQVMGTAFIMILALLILFCGISFGDIDNIGEGFASMDGCLYVFLMVPSMLIGFNIIPVYSEEMNIPPKGIGKMIIVCILFSVAWYIIIIVGLALCAPLEVRMSGQTPAADVFGYAMGDDTFGVIVVFGGLIGILTTWNGFFMGATRMIYAMGRAKMLPSVFSRLHPKYQSPWAAIVMVGVICIAAPFLGKNALSWFVELCSFCSLFAYCCVSISFLILRKKEPELNQPFRLKLGTVAGIVMTLLSIIYLAIYIINNISNIDNNTLFYLIIAWCILGAILAITARNEYGSVSAQEREILIFGEKLARRKI